MIYIGVHTHTIVVGKLFSVIANIGEMYVLGVEERNQNFLFTYKCSF